MVVRQETVTARIKPFMSRGPGRIERAIARVFASDPEATYTVDDLALAAYPGITRVEKKHRVCVLRAVWKVAAKAYWGCRRSDGLGNELVFFNLLNVNSRLIADHRNYRRGHTHALASFEASDKACWEAEWGRVELLRASLDGDDHRHDRLMQEEQERRETARRMI